MSTAQNKACWNLQESIQAASLGMIQELDRLQDLQPLNLWSYEVWTAAAENGQLEVLEWLRNQGQGSLCMVDLEACIIAAANNGHYSICR